MTSLTLQAHRAPLSKLASKGRSLDPPRWLVETTTNQLTWSCECRLVWNCDQAKRLCSLVVLTTVSRELGEGLLQGALVHAEVLQCEALLCIAQSLEIAAVYEAGGRR